MSNRDRNRNNGTKRTVMLVLGLALIISGVAIPLAGYFAIALPAQVQYNRAFGGQISITQDQPTLVGMSTNLMKVWVQMNKTFGTQNHAAIYGSPWYWDQTPDNSLASEDTYFRAELTNLNNYSAAYSAYVKAGTNIIIGMPLQDWYKNTVNNARAELDRNGGLDWAIQGAWYLQFAPAAYWYGYWATAILLVFVCLGCAIIAFRPSSYNNSW